MRCPVCRASIEQGPQCRRCRADLALLFDLEEQRSKALRQAHQALAKGDVEGMLGFAEQAHILRRDEESARLMALGHLLRRDFPAAWQIYTARARIVSP
jgi:hypothetical protein